jgi:hypothetical protein
MKDKGATSFCITVVQIIYFLIVNMLPVFADEKANKSTPAISSKLEISFIYQKQKGMASNQFAVWIEDYSGKYIKTLYATRFTAKGGWEKRQQSLTVWVKASKPNNMSSKEIDAVTGATPSAGNLTYVWDCKDNKGNMVPVGKYKYVVEGTLRWESRVLYNGTIKIGGPAQQSLAKSEFFGGNEQERGMITNVAAKYIP